MRCLLQWYILSFLKTQLCVCLWNLNCSHPLPHLTMWDLMTKCMRGAVAKPILCGDITSNCTWSVRHCCSCNISVFSPTPAHLQHLLLSQVLLFCPSEHSLICGGSRKEDSREDSCSGGPVAASYVLPSGPGQSRAAVQGGPVGLKVPRGQWMRYAAATVLKPLGKGWWREIVPVSPKTSCIASSVPEVGRNT